MSQFVGGEDCSPVLVAWSRSLFERILEGRPLLAPRLEALWQGVVEAEVLPHLEARASLLAADWLCRSCAPRWALLYRAEDYPSATRARALAALDEADRWDHLPIEALVGLLASLPEGEESWLHGPDRDYMGNPAWQEAMERSQQVALEWRPYDLGLALSEAVRQVVAAEPQALAAWQRSEEVSRALLTTVSLIHAARLGERALHTARTKRGYRWPLFLGDSSWQRTSNPAQETARREAFEVVRDAVLSEPPALLVELQDSALERFECALALWDTTPSRRGEPEMQQGVRHASTLGVGARKGAWLVYADWLQECCDPRGVLLSLLIAASDAFDTICCGESLVFEGSMLAQRLSSEEQDRLRGFALAQGSLRAEGERLLYRLLFHRFGSA